MKNLIDALKDRIEKEVPDIKKVDVFNNQFEAMERQQQTPFPFPVVFIEIEPFEWIRRGDGIHVADLRINIHIGVETYIEGNDHLYEIVDKVSGALVRYGVPGCFTPMFKEDETPDSDHDNFIDYQIVFKTRYQDLSGWRQNDKVKFDSSQLGLSLDAQIENSVKTAFDPNLEQKIIIITFESDFDQLELDIDINEDQAGEYVKDELNNVATVSYEVNNSSVNFPFELKDGDVLTVTITRTTADTDSKVRIETK